MKKKSSGRNRVHTAPEKRALWPFADMELKEKNEKALRESEQRFRTVFEGATDGILAAGKSRRFVFANAAICKLTGYSLGELLRLSVSDIHPKKDLPYVISQFKKQLAGEITLAKNIPVLRKDKQVVYCDVNSSLMQIGGEDMMIGFFRDISERKKAEEEILKANAFNSALVENAPFGVMTIKRDGSVDYVNPALLKISGDSRANFKAMNVFKLPTYVKLGLATKIKKCFKGESFFIGPLEYVSHFRGKKTIRNFTGTPMRDEKGGIEKVMLFVEDITEQKRIEENIRKNEVKYKSLIENLPQKIFMKDTNSVYISCNENYAHDLKVKTEEIAGKTDYDFYPKRLADKYIADDKRIMESGKTEDVEEKYVVDDGKEVFVNTIKVPVRDNQGNVIGILGIFQDITERKKADEELKKRTGELERFNHLAVGRELRMVELKKRITELEAMLQEKERGGKK